MLLDSDGAAVGSGQRGGLGGLAVGPVHQLLGRSLHRGQVLEVGVVDDALEGRVDLRASPRALGQGEGPVVVLDDVVAEGPPEWPLNREGVVLDQLLGNLRGADELRSAAEYSRRFRLLGGAETG